MMNLEIYRIILIGDEIHSLYDDRDQICRHFVINKVSGDVIREPAEIHPNLLTVTKSIFVGSRSSIVVAVQSKMDGHMIVEYSLTTK